MAAAQHPAEETQPVLPRNDNINMDNLRRVDDISPESGIVLEGTEFTEKTDKALTNVTELQTERSEALPPNELYNFNLSNPEEITKMLENVNLTDEDTDVLLQEAYNINMKLKEILRRREEGLALSPADEAILQQMVVVVPGSHKDGRAVTADDVIQDRESTFSKNEPLPPIKTTDNDCDPRVTSAIYSAKLNRRPVPQSGTRRLGRTPQSGSSTASLHGRTVGPSSALSRGSVSRPSVPSKKNKGTASKSREKHPVPIEDRPAWNDRYND